MSQLLLVLITAIVTGAISVTGIWFGSNLTRRNEDWKWRRDHALEAYSDFVRAADLLRKETDQIYFTLDCGTVEHVKKADVVYEKLHEMNRTTARIFLLAPDEVREKMHAFTDCMNKQIVPRSIRCPKIAVDEWNAAMTASAEPQVAFMNAARNDLGVHRPLYTVEEWAEIRAARSPWWKLGN
jgi:hypothetical protein